MKKYLFFAAAAVFMAAGCSKSGPKAELQFPEDDGSPVPIIFNSNVSSVSTKSQGAIGYDENNGWNGKQTLYIYGFTKNTDGTETIENITATPYIDCRPSSSPASGLYGEIDVRDGNNEPYYYNGYDVYKFYAYYIDDAKVSYNEKGQPVPIVDAVAGTMSLDFKIDGGQDIMIAQTYPTLDLNAAKKAADDELAAATGNDEAVAAATKKVEELANIETKYKSIIYSSYTSRRGINPTLVFKHQLSRFVFEIIANDETTANSIKIQSLTLGANNKGTLVFVGNDYADSEYGKRDSTTRIINAATSIVEEDGDKAYVDTNNNTLDLAALSLKRKGADGNLVPLEEYSPKVDPEQIGESIMVIPAESYPLLLTMSQDGVTQTPTPVEYIITPSDVKAKNGAIVTAFEAGKQYLVKIKVYSLEKIDFNVELTQWDEVGEIPINPDNPDDYLKNN